MQSSPGPWLGLRVTGTGKNGRSRSTYLYYVVDNEETALNPVAALELLDAGSWQVTGVLGPEAFPAAPFLELLADYGHPHGVEDR